MVKLVYCNNFYCHNIALFLLTEFKSHNNTEMLPAFLRKKFRWCLAAVMTRQNNVPLPEKEMNNLREGENGIFPTLVPGAK